MIKSAQIHLDIDLPQTCLVDGELPDLQTRKNTGVSTNILMRTGGKWLSKLKMLPVMLWVD